MNVTATEYSEFLLQTREKLYEKLKPSGWGEVLRLFIMSDDFMQLLSKLKTLSEEEKHFTPSLKYVFRAFEKCPFKDVKLVIVGQDPYFTPGVADGLAFSCSLTGKPQPSLEYVFKALDIHVHEGKTVYHDPDLTRWSKQGVLLLNSALTVQIGKPGTHVDLWKDFMTYLMDVLAHKKPEAVYVLLGKQAQGLLPNLPVKTVLCTSHPAHAAYTKSKEWEGGHVFVEINKEIEKREWSPIMW
jgi:uracil-DNA glycosylase